MRRMRFTIETFTRMRAQASEPWETNEWDPEDDREDETQYTPRHVQGVIDVDEIQYYFGVRDDRVAVVFKNGAVVSVVAEFEKFYAVVEDME